VERDGSTSWRAVVVTLAVTGAILTVAVTAGSVRGSLPTDTLQIGLSQPADLIRGLLFALYIGLLAHAFYLWLLDRDAPKRKGAGSRQRSPLIPLLALVGLVAVRVLFRDFWDRLTTVAPGTPMDAAPPVTGLPDPSIISNTPAGDAAGGAAWAPIVVGLLILGLVAYVAAMRVQPSAQAGVTSEAVSPRPEPIPTIIGGDPRRRVLAAYQRVERRAEAVRKGRKPQETVTAYLRRLADSEPSHRLSVLYNRARFSIQPISVSEAHAAESAERDLSGGLR
jgi:hypothetical protein